MDERVRAAIAFMNSNLGRKLTPIEIAQAVRLSPSHLRHLFKTETGCPLAHYLKELRLERGKHLLETTFMNVKEVAAAIGIGRVSQFVTEFKRAYRVTPARYTERYRGV